jgi:hypothetical protein
MENRFRKQTLRMIVFELAQYSNIPSFIIQVDRMRLGKLQFDHPVFLAPMSGITDYLPTDSKEYSCSLAFKK